MKKILSILLTMILTLGAVFGLTACVDETEKLVGFDIDFAKEVAKELNLDVEFKEINWDTKEAELETKMIDVIWNGFTYTTERDNGYIPEGTDVQISGVDFTNYYMNNKQVAVVKKSEVANYESDADFNSKNGCAEASSAGADVVKQLGESATGKKDGDVAELDKQLDCLVNVQAGTNDYAVVDYTLACEYILSTSGAYNSSLAVVELDCVTPEYYAVAFREGSNLKDVFNYEMARLYANGKAAEIAAKYNLSDALYNGFEAVDTQNFEMPTTGDYKYVSQKGKIIVGYTIFAPMAYLAK